MEKKKKKSLYAKTNEMRGGNGNLNDNEKQKWK